MKNENIKPIMFVLLLALLVRLPFAITTRYNDLWDDEADYYTIASNLVKYSSFTEYPGVAYSYRPPAYPFYLTLFLNDNHDFFLIKLSQIILSLLTILMIYELGIKFFNPSVGLISSIVLTFYPTSIAYTHYLYSETLFTFLLVLFFYCFEYSIKYNHNWLLFVSGMIYGIACLTREVLFALFPILVFSFYIIVLRKYQLKKYLSKIILFFIALFLTFSPWVIKNYRTHNSFVLISTNGGVNFFYGNNVDTPIFHSWEYNEMHEKKANSQLTKLAEGNEITKNKLGYILGIKHIIKRPDLFIMRFIDKIMSLWEIDRIPIARIQYGYYGSINKFIKIPLIGLVALYYSAIMITSFIGFTFTADDTKNIFISLILALIGGLSFVIGLTFGHTRFHFPLMPLIAIFSARGIQSIFFRLRDIKYQKKQILILTSIFFIILVRQAILDYGKLLS